MDSEQILDGPVQQQTRAVAHSNLAKAATRRDARRAHAIKRRLQSKLYLITRQKALTRKVIELALAATWPQFDFVSNVTAATT